MCKDTTGHGLVADAVRVSHEQRRGDGPRRAARQRPRRLHTRLGLLRHQRRRHGVVRRGAAARRRWASPVRVQLSRRGRNGVGELRLRLRDRPARRRSTPTANDHRVGLRGMVPVARRPARLRHGPATSSPACWLGFEPAPFRPRTPALPSPARFSNGSNAAPSYVRGRVGGTSPAARGDRERARAHAHRRVAVLHRSAPLAVATAEHLRARMLPRRSGGARQGRSGRLPSAAPERPAAQRGDCRRRQRRRTGSASVAAAKTSGAAASPPAAACRASSTRATTATSRWSPRSRSIRTAGVIAEARWSSPRTAGRSRIPTGCGIRSKAARCRA